MARIICGTATGGSHGITTANLAAAKGLGIETVEVSFKGSHIDTRDPDSVRRVASAISDSGIGCRSVHLDFGEESDISVLDADARRAALDTAAQAIAAAAVIGARIAVIHGSDEPIADGERAQRLAALKGSLAESCEVGARSGVLLALELLPRTCLGNTCDEAISILDGLDETRIGFCLDVNHINLREDPAEAVRALGRKILTFHISDNDGKSERHWLPFDGAVDWKPFMAAVRAIGYEGQFIFETGANRKESLEDYLRELRRRFDRLMAL